MAITFWDHFIRLLPRRPAPALAALYWHLTRRRVRARNQLRVASAGQRYIYALWIKHKENNEQLARTFQQAVDQWARRPRFSVIVHADGEQSTQAFERSISSVEHQLYSGSVVDGRNRSLADAIAAARADYVVPLSAGDVLSEGALFRFGEALQHEQGAAILYGDQDEIDAEGGRSRPWFKPRWNEEMFLAQNYLSAAIAIEADLARLASQKAGSFSDFLLAATSQAAGSIVHVPHILCHAAPRCTEENAWLLAVQERVAPAHAKCRLGPFATVKVEWPLPSDLPLVSIIVPTRDKLELLKPCIESVLQRTSYDNFEILIVDNGSAQQRTLAFFREVGRNARVRIISYPGPYNFSAINNFAAKHAKGTYLCLLNNDTEVLTTDWLIEMVRYAVRAEIGAVGAKLLYEDGTIQHAGVVIGMGEAAGHAHRFLPGEEPGYFRQPHVTQFVSAVTAACLVINKSKFFAVGGLDEAHLAVAFNDVDLCLKLQAAGLRNVYVPHAVLVHHESKSRGNDMLPRNIARYRNELHVLQKRWKTGNYDDPHFNPNLDPATETFVIRL
jgi:GT2 family glycosyltransferase